MIKLVGVEAAPTKPKRSTGSKDVDTTAPSLKGIRYCPRTRTEGTIKLRFSPREPNWTVLLGTKTNL